MKTIIASLKAQIEATKKSIEIGKAESEELFDQTWKVAPQNREKGEEFYKLYAAKDKEVRDLEYKLRCLRSALSSVRNALGETDFSCFEPEADC